MNPIKRHRRHWLHFVLRGGLLLAVTATSPSCKKDSESWTPIDVSSPNDDKPNKRTSKKRSSKRSNTNKRSKTKKHSKKSKHRKKNKRSKGPVNHEQAALIERSDVKHLEERARAIHAKLLAVLPTGDRHNLSTVPFIFDPRPGMVNAFAACTRRGKAVISISHGIMQVQAQLARAQAVDKYFKTQKFKAYLNLVTGKGTAGIGDLLRGHRRGRPRLLPNKGFISSKHEHDEKKRRLQAQLLDEGLAFVIAHELAHHRLSHTGCVGKDRGKLTTSDFGRLLSRKVPGFNQPNELAADVYGIHNTMAADHQWKEAGAMLLLRFFKARTKLSLKDSVKFTFERTHPHPDVRIPVVKDTAFAFRLTGGRVLPTLPAVALE